MLLDAVAAEAERRNVRVELFMVGGGAMALAYNQARTTTDIDGVFEPKRIVYEIAAAVAEANPELDLADDWLNDGVKGFLPGDDEYATVFYDEPGLSVRIPNPRYLFALKAMASREGDFDDLRTLWPYTGYQSANEALDGVQALYPRQPIRPAVHYTVEEVAARAAVEAGTHDSQVDPVGRSDSLCDHATSDGSQ